MKTGRSETFILGTGGSKDLPFCRVETEDALYGWGEAYVTQGKGKVVAECIRAMAPHANAPLCADGAYRFPSLRRLMTPMQDTAGNGGSRQGDTRSHDAVQVLSISLPRLGSGVRLPSPTQISSRA